MKTCPLHWALWNPIINFRFLDSLVIAKNQDRIFLATPAFDVNLDCKNEWHISRNKITLCYYQKNLFLNMDQGSFCGTQVFIWKTEMTH